MTAINVAKIYDRADDLWLVTSYFNPVGYRSRRHNYEIFRDRIARSKLNLLTIECAFENDAFSLHPAPDVLQVRAKHIMWQKERLLNLAIARLPSSCVKVAWLDCDLLFENPEWAVQTSRMLNQYPLVQLFETIVKPPRGCHEYNGEGDVLRSFGAAYSINPESVRGGNYDKHGEAGGAWAARRDVLTRCGIYDACIIGGGDHVLVHAMCGDWDSVCISRLMGVDNAHWKHFIRWGEAFHRNVRGEIGYVSGSVLHLWHGERSDRRYSLRHKELESFAFDPEADLRIGETGCWEWASDKHEMHAWAAEYFVHRDEDGTAKNEALSRVEPSAE